MARSVAPSRRRYAAKLARYRHDERSAGCRALTLVDIAVGDDVALSLLAVADLRHFIDELETVAISRARGQGWGWRSIGEGLGQGKSTLHERYRSAGFMGTSESSDTQVVA